RAVTNPHMKNREVTTTRAAWVEAEGAVETAGELFTWTLAIAESDACPCAFGLTETFRRTFSREHHSIAGVATDSAHFAFRPPYPKIAKNTISRMRHALRFWGQDSVVLVGLKIANCAVPNKPDPRFA